MNTKEIVQMATEAGLNSYHIAPEEVLAVWGRFAALVAEKEREAIKALCLEKGGTTDFDRSTCLHLADEISARGAA